MQDFRRLLVWQRAHAFALAVRRAARTFPRGYTELRSQITRAAESIPSNIVEGCASASRKEFAHFLNIAIKSSSEVDYELQLARDNGVLRWDVWQPLADEVVQIRKMLTALRRTVLSTPDRKNIPRPRIQRPADTGSDPDKPEETGPDA